jgi:hypothetical protein
MSTVAAPFPTVQYTTLAGLVMRDPAGRTQPVTLDAVEQQFGQRIVEDALCSPGEWIAVAPSAQPAAPKVFANVEPRGRKFLAYLTIDGQRKPIRVGLFVRECDAHLANEAKARLLQAGLVA